MSDVTLSTLFTERQLKAMRRDGFVEQDLTAQWMPTEKATERACDQGWLQRTPKGGAMLTDAGALLLAVLLAHTKGDEA